MSENTEKMMEKIEDCLFGLDRDENSSKSMRLTTFKNKITQKKFDLQKAFRVKRNKAIMSDEIQEGKNSEIRKAKMELKFAGTKFDNIEELRFLLRIIGNVERHNKNILRMFFGGK